MERAPAAGWARGYRYRESGSIPPPSAATQPGEGRGGGSGDALQGRRLPAKGEKRPRSAGPSRRRRTPGWAQLTGRARGAEEGAGEGGSSGGMS